MRKREFAWLMTLRDERGKDRINRAKVVLIGAGDTDLQKMGGFNVIPKRNYLSKNILPNELRIPYDICTHKS